MPPLRSRMVTHGRNKHACTADGGLAVRYGNLAPDGAACAITLIAQPDQ